MTDAGKTKPEKTTELEKTTKPEKTTRPEKKKKKEQLVRVLAPIKADETYTLQMLRALTGWGDSAMRAARAGGLKPIHLHRRVFFLGSDVVEYIAKAAEAKDAADSDS